MTLPQPGAPEREDVVAFEHERLEVYRLALEVARWVGALRDAPGDHAREPCLGQLERAGASLAPTIAEGHGKRCDDERCERFALALGAALECAACVDVLALRRRIDGAEAAHGKRLLARVVARLGELARADVPAPGPRRMAQVERAEIARALREAGGNRAKAARLLGISPRTVFNRLRRYRELGVPIDAPAAGGTT